MSAGQKSPSQHVSEVLGNLVETLSGQITSRLDDMESRNEERTTKLHARLDQIGERVHGIERCLPTQPCEYHSRLANKFDRLEQNAIEHFQEHGDWLQAKRKIIVGVAVTVLGAGILFAFGSILWALRNGYKG